MNNFIAISSRTIKAIAAISATNDKAHKALDGITLETLDDNRVRIDVVTNAIMCARVDTAQDCAVPTSIFGDIDVLPDFGRVTISTAQAKALVKIGINCTHVIVNTSNGYMVYTNEVGFTHFKPLETIKELPKFDKFFNNIDYGAPNVHIGVNVRFAIMATQLIESIAGKDAEMRMLATKHTKPIYYTHKDNKTSITVCVIPVLMSNDIQINFNHRDVENIVIKNDVCPINDFYNIWRALYNRKPNDEEIKSFKNAFLNAAKNNEVSHDEMNCIDFTPAIFEW